MAHRILGIDCGAYSVKIAVVVAGFRKSQVVDWLEAPVPPPMTEGESLEARQARAAAELVRARGFEHDFPFAALPGDAVSLRILDFSFQGLKRADLDKAVGAELEAQLPHDLDDIVYTYDTVPKGLAGPRVDGEEPPAAPEVGMRILAAATTRERVARTIELLG